MKKYFTIFNLTLLLILMLSAYSDLPPVGDITNPSNNETYKYYLNNAINDTNAPNVVTDIVADYRSIDTLGETTVLFTSITAVLSVLAPLYMKKCKEEKQDK